MCPCAPAIGDINGDGHEELVRVVLCVRAGCLCLCVQLCRPHAIGDGHEELVVGLLDLAPIIRACFYAPALMHLLICTRSYPPVVLNRTGVSGPIGNHTRLYTFQTMFQTVAQTGHGGVILL